MFILRSMMLVIIPISQLTILTPYDQPMARNQESLRKLLDTAMQIEQQLFMQMPTSMTAKCT
jgi:hypothetical protein